ncbi:SHOCT domain-containing protein [Alicyclobacillaceae bacterium I2511]|nr:SHOCT domain-containing protein [Alicyclobacillaceae bacterium I2511]
MCGHGRRFLDWEPALTGNCGTGMFHPSPMDFPVSSQQNKRIATSTITHQDTTRPGPMRADDTLLKIIKERYARGEIDQATFLEMKSELS